MPDGQQFRVGDRVTVYPRGKKNTYVADFWQDGKHCKVSLRTANKKVAIERATKIAADLAGGVFAAAPAPVTVRQAVDDYIASLETENRARKTVVKYRGVFELFLAFLEQTRVIKPGQVTAGHFDRFRAERRRERHPKTVTYDGVVVKQLFKWVNIRKLIHENPLADVRLNKPPMVPKEAPGLKEVDALIAAADPTPRAWIVVLAFTGMRVGEMQRLRPEDFDLAGGWVHIRSRPGAETKTRQSRKVPIHLRLRSVLEVLPRDKRSWLFTIAPSPKYPAGGHHINPRRVNDRLAKLLERVGLPAGRDTGFVVHSLRHFFETFTVNAGIPQRAVDAWMGHNSDKSMAAVYYRLRDEESQGFMAKVPFGAGEPAADASGEVQG